MSCEINFEMMWKVECELNKELKQQLESLEKENRGLKMMLNHVAGVEHVCEDLEVKLAEAVEVIKELNDIVIGHIEESDKLDSFTLQPARQFLARYHSVNANEMVVKYRGRR